QLAGVGARFSFGDRHITHSASRSAAPRAHSCRRGAAAYGVRRRIRSLLHPHVAAHSHALLKQAAAAEQSCRRRDWERIVVHRENTSAPDGLRTYRGALSGGRTVSLANSATLAESPIVIYYGTFPLKSHGN